MVLYGYDNVGNMTSGDGKTLSYNAFNKPTLITNNSIRSAFSYGADLSRYKQVKTTGAKTETTHYVDKLFEKVVTQETGKATTTEYVHYIGDVAIVRKKVTAGQALPEHRIGFTHRDRLGSVVTVTDHNSNATEHRSYDAFGKPRKGDFSNPSHATLTSASGLASGKSLIANRGFTDHEHLDEHQLIHMNGRAYDYNLGRFLSVDPFIQAPGNSQSMNPYSYIMNNPLSGTDPSGYKSECDKQDGGQCGEKPKPKPKPKEGKKKRRKTKGFSQNWSTIYQAPVSNGHQSNQQGSKANDANAKVEKINSQPLPEQSKNRGGILTISALTPEELAEIESEKSAAMAAQMRQGIATVVETVVPFGDAMVKLANGDVKGALQSALKEGAVIVGTAGVGYIVYKGYKAYKGVKKLDGFFDGTKYTPKVKEQMTRGDFHAFPESVKAFRGSGKIKTITGNDGIRREMLEIRGGYKGREGKFEFMKEPNGDINHRLFKETRD